MTPLRVEIPQNAVEWLDGHFYLPEGSSQIPGRWITQPAQIVPANMMGNDAIKVFCMRKPTRFGYTKLVAGITWYMGVHKKRSSASFMPTDTLRDQFVTDEINPLLAMIPAIQQVFPDWSVNNENNKMSKKTCIGFSIDFKGADTPNALRSMTKQLLLCDEISSWRVNSGEGDTVGVLTKRIQGAPFGKLILGSTANYKGDVLERQMTAMHCIFQFLLPCPHCGTLQVLEWGSKEDDHGMKWDPTLPTDEAKAKSVFYLCKNHLCRQKHGGKIYYNQSHDMQLAGVWVCRLTGIYTRDGEVFYHESGRKVTAPKKVGVEISALYSMNLMEGWAELVAEWLDIKGDVNKLQVFFNLTLGLPWDPVRTRQFSHDELKDRREAYPSSLPPDVVYLVAGGDTQDDRMEAYVWGFTADEQQYLIDKFLYMGDPRNSDVQDAVVDFCKRTYQDANGRTLPIARICWDSAGHRTQDVYNLSQRIGLLRFIPIRGANQYQQPVQQMPAKLHKKSGTFLTLIGTDTVKDQFYTDLAEPLGNARSVHLPDSDAICSELVCKQLVSEVQKPKKTKTGVIYVYDNEGRRNEALDCYVYAKGALQISIEKFGLVLSQLSATATTAKTADPIEQFKALGEKLGAN